MVRLEINTTQFQQQMSLVAYRQLPFATALALTRCAEEVVQQEIADLPAHFHIRNSWVAKGFRVKRATKASLVAEIGHKDAYMVRQEYGGEKRPEHAKDVAIPKGARPNVQALTRPAKWPGNIPRRFYIFKGDTVYEYARTGRRGAQRKRVRHKHRYGGRYVHDLLLESRGYDPNLKLMYVMKRSVSVKPRMGLRDLATRVMSERWPVNFAGFLDFAIKTAK